MMQPSIKPADEHSAGDIIARIGSLTRMLSDSLRELGLDQAIAEAAEAIPDARDRLYYVVQMTAQAAERALNSVEASQPHQDQMEKSAKALTQRWDDWFADPIDLADARELVTDTRQFLADVPAHTSFTNAQLLEIMMAQDFQDLTGQVITKFHPSVALKDLFCQALRQSHHTQIQFCKVFSRHYDCIRQYLQHLPCEEFVFYFVIHRLC